MSCMLLDPRATLQQRKPARPRRVTTEDDRTGRDNRKLCLLSAPPPMCPLGCGTQSPPKIRAMHPAGPVREGHDDRSRGNTLYRVGHPLPRIGQAHRERGGRQEVALLRPGRASRGVVLGGPLLLGDRRLPCVAGFVPREHVLDLGRRYPELLAAAHLHWEEREHALTKRLVDLAYASVRRRLVRVLLDLAEEHGVREVAKMRIDLPLSLGDLAEMIGASRQATCEELRMLRAEGLIEVAWPKIFVADVEHLRQLS